MLGRAGREPFVTPAELKAHDERKDTLILLVGAVAVLGFTAISLQLHVVALVTLMLLGLGLVRTVVTWR